METNSITDYLQQIEDLIPALQMGLLPDGIGKVYHKFAESDTIEVTPSIMNSFQNPDPFNDAGDALYISSSSTDTTLIYLEGVEHGTGNIISEYITLTGQTAVPLTKVFRTIFRGFNANGVPLIGDVWVGTEAIPAAGVPNVLNAYCHIPASYGGKVANQTITSIFTIPTGFSGFVTNWYGNAPKGKDIELIAYARQPGGVFRYQEHLFNYQSSAQKQLPWLKFPAGADFKVEGITSQGTQNGIVTYDLVLVSNDFISKFRPLSWR
jgi:hypothetical protein